MKAANILCALGSPEGARFHFIDLVGVGRSRSILDAERAQDLSRLNVSFLQNPQVTRTSRLRFLRAYLRWSLHGRGDWKSWWKRISRATLKKIERNRRTGSRWDNKLRIKLAHHLCRIHFLFAKPKTTGEKITPAV